MTLKRITAPSELLTLAERVVTRTRREPEVPGNVPERGMQEVDAMVEDIAPFRRGACAARELSVDGVEHHVTRDTTRTVHRQRGATVTAGDMRRAFGGLYLGESLGQVGIFLIFILVLLLRPQGLFGAKA